MSNWIPSHQEHLQYTLAHVDSVIAKLGEVAFAYLKGDPLELENRFEGDHELVVVKSIAPLPEALTRLAADALNQLRSALEHALYAELEFLRDEPLSESQGKSLEMPIQETTEGLTRWHAHGVRKTIPELLPSGVLGARIGLLQPFHGDQPSSHPLVVLAQHTNLAKHRMPAVAGLRVGRVIPDYEVAGMVIHESADDSQPFQAGETLAIVPRGQVVGLNIWPKIGIQRASSGSWHVLMTELKAIEEWVRTHALPILVTGQTQAEDTIKPCLNIATGYETFAQATAAASSTPAADRHLQQIQGEHFKTELTDMALYFFTGAKLQAISEAISALTNLEAYCVFKEFGTTIADHGTEAAIQFVRRTLLNISSDPSRSHYANP